MNDDFKKFKNLSDDKIIYELWASGKLRAHPLEMLRRNTEALKKFNASSTKLGLIALSTNIEFAIFNILLMGYNLIHQVNS